jgi:predicted Rossmann fold flavoprotein
VSGPSDAADSWDVIVVGAGAAGLMCAMEAGRRGRSVLVLEKEDRPGKKILISGGGRCNFTNIGATADQYLSSNSNFCKSALARYTPRDFLALVEAHGIAWHEKKLGQLFCDVSSKQIVSMLEAECRAAKVRIQTGCSITEVSKPGKFLVRTHRGALEASSLVVAAGGLSFPKLGATGFGYDLARQFGHTIVPLRPGLVPLTLAPAAFRGFQELSGISLDCLVSFGPVKFRENILFTHRGLSGPAILQISSYWDGVSPIQINLLPGVPNLSDRLKNDRQSEKSLSNWLAPFTTRRFAQLWCEFQGAAGPLRLTANVDLQDFLANLESWRVVPSGTEGYPKAEVTVGGVDTGELSSKTMESRKVPGLFFIGEVVDVTGWLGGYNFQWAWSSGHAAGEVV